MAQGSERCSWDQNPGLLALRSLVLSRLCSLDCYGKMSREVSLVQADAHQALGSTHSSGYLHICMRGSEAQIRAIKSISVTNQWACSYRRHSTKVKSEIDFENDPSQCLLGQQS